MSTSTLITPRRVHGGAAHTVVSPFTGHRIRLVREHPADVARTVYLATDDGLVLLGTVTHMGAGAHYALPPLGIDGGWPVKSFRDGALTLDVNVDATPIPSYLVTRRDEAAAAHLLVDRAHVLEGA